MVPTNSSSNDTPLLPTATPISEPECNSSFGCVYDHTILSIVSIVGLISLVCAAMTFTAYKIHKARKAKRQQQERLASRSQSLYAELGQGGTNVTSNMELRRLSQRIAITLPMNMQRPRPQGYGGSSSSVGSNGTVIHHVMPRSGLPRAPVRCRSVDTLPRYEETENEGGWKNEQLFGGARSAV